jgi:sialidase-1
MTWNAGPDSEDAITEGTSSKGRRIYVTSSKDNGIHWDKLKDITTDVKRPNWGWYATGPVNGIQLRHGPHAGRLVIPANHSAPNNLGKQGSFSHVIFSDDHGATWQIGGIEEEFTNESTIAELSDGRIMHNMRSYAGKNLRAVATSSDSGMTWSSLRLDPHLPEPVCQGSLFRHSWPANGKPGIVLFANPASRKREKMTVRASFDDCETWTVQQVIHTGPSAYSCLTLLPDKTIGCLFECGEKNPYEKIVLSTFTLDWLKSSTSAK